MREWSRRKNTQHLWAFVYYCKRQGDDVQTLEHPDGTITVRVETR